MTDIVERLRAHRLASAYPDLQDEAADEIERLRQQNRQLNTLNRALVEEVERLKREIEKWAWDKRDHDTRRDLRPT